MTGEDGVDSLPGVRPLREAAVVDELLRVERAVLYKHSPICGSSALAVRQVQTFAAANPGVAVYTVDVIRERELSNRLAEAIGVTHESPQVIILHHGRPGWCGSHFEVTAENIARNLADG